MDASMSRYNPVSTNMYRFLILQKIYHVKYSNNPFGHFTVKK